MTEQQKEAIKYIESQLEDGYLDLGLHENCELEIIKEAINLWKIANKVSFEAWKRLGYSEEEVNELIESQRIHYK